MELKQQTYRVLVVTASKMFRSSAAEILSDTQCTAVQFVSDVSAAKRAVAEKDFDFVIVNAPLPDDAGIRFALDTSDQRNAVVLLMLPPDLYAESSDRAIRHGVFLLPKPISRSGFLTAVSWLSSARELVRRSEQKIQSVDEKMKEIRVVNRAKWLLIECLHMTEPEAHRYITRQAMEQRTGKKEIAENVIRTYQ